MNYKDRPQASLEQLFGSYEILGRSRRASFVKCKVRGSLHWESDMKFKILSDKCVTCDACRLACPRNAISAAEIEKTYVIDGDLCNGCQNVSAVRCIPQCPTDAIVER